MNAGWKEGIKSYVNFGFSNPYTSFSSTSPLTGRSRFISKTSDNLVIIFSFFVIFVFFASALLSGISANWFPMLIMDGIAILGAYYFYNLWDKRTIRVACPKCRGIISSSTPWVCKACGAKNLDADNFPFLFKCKECGTAPKAYRCHHKIRKANSDTSSEMESGYCNEIIFLTEDRDENNYAHGLNFPAEMPALDKHAEDIRVLREKRATMVEERENALVEEDLNRIQKRQKEESKEKPSGKSMVASDVNYIMELEEAEVALKAEYEQKYMGNKPMLKRMKAALKASVQSRKAERM